MLRSKLQKAGVFVPVVNYAVNEIPGDVQLVITHEKLAARAQTAAPQAKIIGVSDFFDASIFDRVQASAQFAERRSA